MFTIQRSPSTATDPAIRRLWEMLYGPPKKTRERNSPPSAC